MFSVLVILLRSLRLMRVSGIVMRLRMFLLLITFLKASHLFRNGCKGGNATASRPRLGSSTPGVGAGFNPTLHPRVPTASLRNLTELSGTGCGREVFFLLPSP